MLGCTHTRARPVCTCGHMHTALPLLLQLPTPARRPNSTPPPHTYLPHPTPHPTTPACLSPHHTCLPPRLHPLQGRTRWILSPPRSWDPPWEVSVLRACVPHAACDIRPTDCQQCTPPCMHAAGAESVGWQVWKQGRQAEEQWGDSQQNRGGRRHARLCPCFALVAEASVASHECAALTPACVWVRSAGAELRASVLISSVCT